jgi:hypothetical protein
MGKSHDSDDMVTKVAVTIGALAAAMLARKVLTVGWKGITGHEPPSDPRSQDTDWQVAALWAIASGAAVGVARLAAERKVASKMTGKPAVTV